MADPAEEQPSGMWVGSSCEEDAASGRRHRQRGTWWGSAQNHCCWTWEPCPEYMSRTGLPVSLLKRGAAVLLSCSLEEHTKPGLGAAVLPSGSLCKSKGKVKKNQYRGAAELKDQCRKIEVSLATWGTKGTKSSWQPPDESKLRGSKSLVKIYYSRVRDRETAHEGLLWRCKALPFIYRAYINKLKIKSTSKKAIWRHVNKKVPFAVYCCS